MKNLYYTYAGMTIGNNESRFPRLSWCWFYVTHDSKESAYYFPEGTDMNRVSKRDLRKALCCAYDESNRGGFGKITGGYPHYTYESNN